MKKANKGSPKKIRNGCFLGILMALYSLTQAGSLSYIKEKAFGQKIGY
jgi:hypothetical protein